VIGKYLLQRNIIKFVIPVVNIPLSMKLNHWQTGQVAKKARVIYRDKAAIQEYASELVAEHEVPPELLLDTVYYVASADGHITAEESWLLKHLTDALSEAPSTAETVKRFAQMVRFDSQKFLDDVSRLPPGTQAEVFDVAVHVAACDHEIAKDELVALRRLSSVCAVQLDEEKLRSAAKVGIG
jgi:tellurite resistance protein